MLRMDVERLKGELAKAHEEPGRGRAGERLTGARVMMGQREIAKTVGRAAGQNESKATVTPHGPRCQGLCCRGG